MHPMPSVDESLCRLGKRRYFTKLDANSGCWLPLGEESKLLTTFVTPFVRYCFNCPPFGICCAPDIFQPTMLETFKDADGVICQMDHGADQEEHDTRQTTEDWRLELPSTLRNASFSRLCEIPRHHYWRTGNTCWPNKDTSHIKVSPTQNVKDLQCFMRMVNHLRKFIPRLAEMSEPVRQLLCKDSTWLCTDP